MVKRKVLPLVLLALLAALVPQPASAATVTWDGGVDGNLTTAGNWDTDTAPVAGDDVILNTNGNDPTNYDLAVQLGSTTFANHQQESQEYAYILQVRDGDSVSIFIGIMTGTIGAGETADVSTLWTAPTGESSSYEIIVFVLSSLESPEILSAAHSSSFGVA